MLNSFSMNDPCFARNEFGSLTVSRIYTEKSREICGICELAIEELQNV